jgi:hypothetical protein
VENGCGNRYGKDQKDGNYVKYRYIRIGYKRFLVFTACTRHDFKTLRGNGRVKLLTSPSFSGCMSFSGTGR